MKKNITVNLFGSLYAIDEDAYELLEKYLDSIKRYFSKRDGGDEIADDIEHRVAELFAELKNSDDSEAISIENVQDIIKRIGNPEQMDDDSTDETSEEGHKEEEYNYSEYSSANDKKSTSGRKLYRDPDKPVLGGVLSGICAYFGGSDPLPWRLIFLILAVATKIIPFFIIYLILWALIPEASTPEERLKMKGRPINIDTLNEEIMNESNVNKNSEKGIMSAIITIIGFCLKLFFGLFIALILITLIIVVFALILELCTPFDLTGFGDESEILIKESLIGNPSISVTLWISVISAIIFTSLLLYSIVHSIINKNSGQRMSGFTRITLVIITILSMFSCVFFGIATYNKIDNTVNEYYHKTNTINGIYLSGNQHLYLANNGWQLDTYENASDILYRKIRNFYDDDLRSRYFAFSREDASKPMNINLYKTEDFPEGNYHIEAIASSKCNGAYVYASSDSTTTSAMIPVDDSRNKGNMQYMSDKELRNTVFFNIDPSDYIWEDDDFRKKVSYWSYIRSESFHHNGGPLKYGTTNMGSVIGNKDNNFPAWGFCLRLIKIVADK